MAICGVAASLVASLRRREPWASTYDLAECLAIAAVLGTAGFLVQRRIYRPPTS